MLREHSWLAWLRSASGCWGWSLGWCVPGGPSILPRYSGWVVLGPFFKLHSTPCVFTTTSFISSHTVGLLRRHDWTVVLIVLVSVGVRRSLRRAVWKAGSGKGSVTALPDARSRLCWRGWSTLPALLGFWGTGAIVVMRALALPMAKWVPSPASHTAPQELPGVVCGTGQARAPLRVAHPH